VLLVWLRKKGRDRGVDRIRRPKVVGEAEKAGIPISDSLITGITRSAFIGGFGCRSSIAMDD